MVRSENRKDWCVWWRCWWLQHGLVPMAMGWRRVPARHLDTVQYSNWIWSHWIFVFDSFSKFRGYSIRIQDFKDIRFEWNSTFIPSLPPTHVSPSTYVTHAISLHTYTTRIHSTKQAHTCIKYEPCSCAYKRIHTSVCVWPLEHCCGQCLCWCRLFTKWTLSAGDDVIKNGALPNASAKPEIKIGEKEKKKGRMKLHYNLCCNFYFTSYSITTWNIEHLHKFNTSWNCWYNCLSWYI